MLTTVLALDHGYQIHFNGGASPQIAQAVGKSPSTVQRHLIRLVGPYPNALAATRLKQLIDYWRR